MANSPFRNFDLEKIQHDDLNAVFTTTALGTYAVGRLLLHCAITCRVGERLLDNDRYVAIVGQIPQYDAEQPMRQVEYGDYLPITPHPPIRDISNAQFHAVRALMLIDEVLDIVATQGWCAAAIDRLLLATEWESAARNNQVDTAHQRTLQRQSKKWDAAVERSMRQRDTEKGKKNARANQKGREHDAQKAYAKGLFAAAAPYGVWRSKRAAAKCIAPQVRAYAQREGYKYVFVDSGAERTIYDALLRQSA